MLRAVRPAGRPGAGDDVRAAVWQTTHVGGCRFAANLICLPHGLYYGRLTPETAVAAAAAHAGGRVELDVYRGRAGAPQAVQSAKYHTRRQEGLTGIDDLSLVAHRRLRDGSDEVCLRAGPYAYRVQVRLEPHGPSRPHGAAAASSGSRTRTGCCGWIAPARATPVESAPPARLDLDAWD